MVNTRSNKGEATEAEERRLAAEAERQQRISATAAIEALRRGVTNVDSPASPSDPLQSTSGAALPSTKPTETHGRTHSPTRSHRSVRSTDSATLRVRLAELEAAEKLAEIRRKELRIEADLIQKRLAAEVASIRDNDSVHDEAEVTDNQKVDQWLNASGVPARGERGVHPNFERSPLRHNRRRSPSPPRHNCRRSPSPPRHDCRRSPPPRHDRRRSPTPRRGIEQLAEAIEKMARHRPRNASDLPTFTGAPNEWLPFHAAMRDSTTMYNISPAENILRLRNSLKGEARDAVAALLHTATDPGIIMQTLEQSFGRPELIIDRAMEELKKMPKPGPSATDLNAFAVKVQNVVHVLKTLDRRGYLYNPMLVREILDKLSPHVRSRWCDYADDHEMSMQPEIIKMSQFLMREADRALRYTYMPAASTTREHKPAAAVKPAAAAAINRKKPNAVYTVDDSEQLDGCPKCSQAHALYDCPAYRALEPSQRWDLVREKGLCFRCIKSKHRRFRCKAKLCGVNQCRRPHHPTLHEEPSQSATRNAASPAPASASLPEQDHAAAVHSVATHSTTEPRAVLLKVCPVTVGGPLGEVNTYALLDEGATVTLVDEDLAKKVGAEGPSHPLHLHGVNMSQRERESKIVAMTLQGKNSDKYPIRARTVRDLQLHQQTVPTSLLDHKHLQDLKQEVCYEHGRPLILVGTDHWEVIVTRELRVGGPGEPAASRTQLGWVVHGTVPRGLIYHTESALHVYEHDRRENELHDRRLHDLVEEHFRIDALGIAHKPRVSENDQRAVKIVQNTMKKVESGYEVGLPWKRDDVTMPPSYDLALRRLRSIERKMDTDPSFAEAYTAQMNNLLTKGYAAPCDGSEQGSPVQWYLPHFAVRNPNKPGKPPRLVFDAAQKCHGVSLNDELLEGPDLLMSLPGIVFRFREKPIAVTADIQEMFLRIKIRPEDQPAQMFLWRGSNRTSPPQEYKMKSLIFGAASSPFIAHSVRDHNARMHAETHPRALEAITRSHYMDDLVDSYTDVEEARRTISEIREVHSAAGFTLRGWSANDHRVLHDVPKELHATSPTPIGTENKILGLWWDAKKDELGFNTGMHRVPADVRTQERAPTKREALSAVMSIYDPLGLLSLYTIRAKITLQGLWRLQLGWDEPIPPGDAEDFNAWLQQLDNIARLRLPRCYALTQCDAIELHVFCDASEQAYAAVAYWRATQEEGVKTALIAAKAKVAPRRAQSIPRLELQAAVIGARLANTIKTEHRIEVTKTVYWTDSATVVHWIQNDARRYTPFVAHRLGEIAELTHKGEWRWLPTHANVADDATRHSHASIDENHRWFHGPDFLAKPEHEWPSGLAPTEDEAEVLHTSDQDTQRSDWLPDHTRFSKYETLVRATARVLAFIDICRRRATRMNLEHIQRAERAILRRAQAESFSAELKKMEAAHSVPRTSRLYHLDPVMEEGLLRVRGRIEASSAPAETKRPIILDGRHHITKLIVMREHCSAGHANRERVTNDLRQRYWILHLRPTVRAAEHSCALCRVRKAKPRTPPAGDLPRARLDPFHRPFTNCGVDYFGPIMVKVGRRHEKRWCALFTCLTVRAIHLELVTSLSTDSAIMALRRMAARRGWPSIMYSDNATNFRGADNELRAAYTEWAPVMQEYGLLHRMKWIFIPPGAPNQGGAWERMVRSVKTALQATLKEKTPPEEVLHTLLTEAENSVNSRPLTHVSVSPHDLEALTPNHFLLGSSMGLPTTGPCDAADRRTWRASQALADHFWKRWVKEYLPTLIPRGSPKSNGRRIQVDDIVAVVDPTLPRNVWPLGIVTRTYIGPDGDVRVADVKTKAGIFKRPITRLVVLLKKEEATQAAPGGEMLRTTSDTPLPASPSVAPGGEQPSRAPARSPASARRTRPTTRRVISELRT